MLLRYYNETNNTKLPMPKKINLCYCGKKYTVEKNKYNFLEKFEKMKKKLLLFN